MDIFKLFNKERKGREMMKVPAPEASEKIRKSELIWQKFWAQYDGVMEFACMRQSSNLSPEHAEKIEKMFIESLRDLIINTKDLIDDYKKNQEEK